VYSHALFLKNLESSVYYYVDRHADSRIAPHNREEIYRFFTSFFVCEREKKDGSDGNVLSIF